MFKAEAQKEWHCLYSIRAAQTKRVQWNVAICYGGPPVTSMERSVAVTTHRLRCGKALTGSTLHQMRVATNDMCTACGVREDALRVLEECTKYSDEGDISRNGARDIMDSEQFEVGTDERLAWSVARFVKYADIKY